MGIPGTPALPMSGTNASQQEQYLAAVQAAAAASGGQSVVQGPGQTAGLSVPFVPYPYGATGVPLGAVYNPIAAAQAAANLVQQQQINGGVPHSQSPPTNNTSNMTNGRRPASPQMQTAGPPTPGPPSDNSTPGSGITAQNASPNAPYIIPAFIDPSSGQLVRLGGAAGQIQTQNQAPVRLMGPTHPGAAGPGATTPILMNNQQQAQQQQLAANLAALAASNPAAAAAAQAAGFPGSVALLNQQPNSFGVGNNSSNISSLGSPSISSISGKSIPKFDYEMKIVFFILFFMIINTNLFTFLLGSGGNGRRDSMDRNSQNSSTAAFSPSLFDQYNKNKQGLQGPPTLAGHAGNQALTAQAQAALNAAAAWNYGIGKIAIMAKKLSKFYSSFNFL